MLSLLSEMTEVSTFNKVIHLDILKHFIKSRFEEEFVIGTIKN